MSRYFGYVVIDFMDDSTERVGGNRHEVREGVLQVWTESYGARDHHYFPLANIKSWRWEER